MSFTLHRPRTPEEALLLQKETGGSYLAGGTVTLVNYHRSLEIGGDIISLEAIPGWDSITATETEIQIGPLVTFDRIESSELLHREATALWQAAREVGGPQIRNRATIGGNLCAASPSADAVAMPGVLPVLSSVKVWPATGRVKVTASLSAVVSVA